VQKHRFYYRGVCFLYDSDTGRYSVPGKEGRLTEEGTSLPEEAHGPALQVPAPTHYGNGQGLGDSLGTLGPYVYHRPRRIQLAITPSCNLACRYCYVHKCGADQAPTMMSDTVAARSVDYLARESGRRQELTVAFIGGEPLLGMPVIESVVSYCRWLQQKQGKRFRFQIVTNGTLLTESVNRFLVGHEFGVVVSIDGYREMHDAMRVDRTGRGTFDTVVRNTKALQQSLSERHPGRSVGIRATMTADYCDARRIHAALAAHGHREVVISANLNSSLHDPDHHGFRAETWEQIFHATEEVMLTVLAKKGTATPLDSYESELRDALATLGAPRSPPILGQNCGVGRNAMTVGADGSLFPCHRYLGIDSFVVGDVLAGKDFHRLHRLFRSCQQLRRERCASCWLQNRCKGPCVWTLSQRDGTIGPLDDTYCAIVRKEMERDIWFHYCYGS
jgi:uncharacterized protein